MKDCPVVTRSTKVVAVDVASGSKITVTPVPPLAVDALRLDTTQRMVRLAERPR
jgi:hypothetical protein